MSEDRDERLDHPFHAMTVEDVAEVVGVDPQAGVRSDEVVRRRARYGENTLSKHEARSFLERLAGQFHNPFIYVLLVAAVITAALSEWLDASVIVGVVVAVVVTGLVFEGRAERAIEAVRDMLTPTARALRDGAIVKLPSAELVVGDLVLLEAGDRVPADLRLVAAKNLRTQEAALTGESAPVSKRTEPVDADAALGDRSCMAYAGTLVATGTARGLVVHVGDHTEIGRIGRLLGKVEPPKTPLDRRLETFTRWVSVGIVALAAITFLVGFLVWDRAPAEMFFAAVAIAVAAIPEGLPAVMTVTLANGVSRMAARRAIIRRLPAVETLGSVTVICSDKTGTLTKNEMTVRTVRLASAVLEVEGAGIRPEGGLREDGAKASLDTHPALEVLARAGLLASDATLKRRGDDWVAEGDPTEIALVVLAEKLGLAGSKWPRLDAIPFDPERCYMATLNEGPEGARAIFVKGAPERLLSMCHREATKDGERPLDRDAWTKAIDEIAARGQRVLALATRNGFSGAAIAPEDVESGLTWLGLVGLIDPPRPEAIEAVATCHRAGIRVKMITGDHEITAQAIARELGLLHPERSLAGRALAELDDAAFRRAATEVNVFARTSPEQKLRLVEALSSEGEIVAMTGDGVNDAPALKRADVGIAMGKKGTDAAREVAAMVLADDDFASIEHAVEEGRTVYDNLKKTILFILPTDAAEALIIALAILAGAELPMTPLHVLWVNTITAATLGMALAWESAEGDVMARPPRPPEEPLLTRFVVFRILYAGILLLLASGYVFATQRSLGVSLAEAQTACVNALVVAEMFYLFSARSSRAPAFTLSGIFGSRAVIVSIVACLLLQIAFTHAPFMNALFGTAPIDSSAWERCVGVGIAVFVLVEIEKLVRRRWHARRATAPAA
ncbi:MAG: HAD-IC family P-type ATPase [Myxococcales bacterium]|nr:HAD-IC family P-type ATPase [Myxococcales bacterium]